MKKRRIKIKRVPENAETITRGIINFLISEGNKADRVNVQGIYMPESGTWRKSGMKKGFSDIVASLAPYGRYCAIEIKYDSDTKSKEQIEFMNDVRASGGIYLEIKTYQEFIDWYCNEWPQGRQYKEKYNE